MPENKPSKVMSIYLPERDEIEKIAVNETKLRKKPVTTGSIIREVLKEFIAKYWKR